MIPRSPQFASLIPLLCPPLLSSSFPLFSVSLRIVPHAICGFCFINNVGGSWLYLYLVLSSVPLKVTVHTGVSVQRRDRCTGMQQGTQDSSFIIVRFIVLSMPGPYLFRPLKQLVATLICSRCECQLRCNRSGSMGSLCTGVLNVLSSRELRLY